MTPEFEARFLDIDADVITARLRDRGAACTMPRTLMRRVVLKNQDISDRGGWLRLREQGDKTLLTYKQVNDTNGDAGIDSILESEVEVADFQAAQHLLEAMGFTTLRYQENYREEWQLDGVVFDLDTWPDLSTYLEVEGTDEEAVRAAVAMLGLDYGPRLSVVSTRSISRCSTATFSPSPASCSPQGPRAVTAPCVLADNTGNTSTQMSSRECRGTRWSPYGRSFLPRTSCEVSVEGPTV